MPNEPEDRDQEEQPIRDDDNLVGRGDETEDDFEDVEDIDETEENDDLEER